MGGGASKKAAGKKEKYKNTQLAAAVLELKEPLLNSQRGAGEAIGNAGESTGQQWLLPLLHSSSGAWLKP